MTVNARQRVDLTLKIGNMGETVVVTGAAKLLETESSDRGQVIRKEQIVNLPLNGRNYADLALLSPGVRRSAIADSRDASFNVNGLRSAVNSFILDGVDNNSYGTSNQGFSNQIVQVSPDAVEEFKVQTNNFSAEFGRTGGAVINASLRSGTNAFRGTVWEFHRNTALNAVGFFKPTRGIKPKLLRNQFGFVFGGPIVRNRTFFFVDYEGFRQISRTLMFASIPTPEQRQGILGKPIQNPLTGEIYANGVIPASAITPFAQKVLAGLPAPTSRGHLEQLRLAAAPPGLQRQVRREGRSHVQRAHDGLCPHESSQGEQLRAFSDPRRHRESEQRVRARAERSIRRRLHLHGDPGIAPRSPARNLADRGRQEHRARSPQHAGALRNQRPADRSEVFGRPHGTGHFGVDDVRAPEQQSAVPGSKRHQSADQLYVGQGAAELQDRVRVPGDQHED